MTSENPQPGWYPDPHGGPGPAYWDGGQWRLDVPAPSGSGIAPPGMALDQALGIASSPYPGGQAAAPYGGPAYVDAYGRPLSDKSKIVAALLQIFLSPFAVGRFYLGYTNIAVIQIVVTIFSCGIGAWWPIIDGILILMGRVPDAQGRTLRD